MNRLAALIDRLASADDDAKHRLLADYFANVPDGDRDAASRILAGRLKPRRATLALVRGLAEERIDAKLFELSRNYVSDVAETIALTWPARPGANRPPSPAEIVEGLGNLGRSELPKRIAAWLDATDANGRWAVIKLATGTLPASVTPEQVDHALTTAGAPPAPTAARHEDEQNDMFEEPGASTALPGEIDAILMYVERGRARSSPMTCTFGLWSDGMIVPVGRANLTLADADAARFDDFVRQHTINRFGPVLEVMRSADSGLVFEVTYEGIKQSPRRKAGLALEAARITRLWWDKRPREADTVEVLDHVASARRLIPQ
jgi:ATP-dependent DNA ligase